MYELAIEAIYEASSQPDLWPAALEKIAGALNAVGSLIVYRRKDGRMGTVCSPSFEVAAQDYERDWAHRDIRAERSFEFFSSGKGDVATDRHIVTEAEIAASPIYQEFLLPRGLLWSAAAASSPVIGVDVMLSVIRSSDARPFESSELSTLEALSKHAERSLSLSMRLLDAEAIKTSLSRALELLSCGVIVVDDDATVVYQNALSSRILGEGLRIVSGKIRATWPDDHTKLMKSLTSFSQGRNDGPHPCLILNQRGGNALTLRLLPVNPARTELPLGSALTMILMVEQRASEPIDPAFIRDALSLTLGEAKMASLIGAGLAPQEASRRLGIKISTARFVLKQIYQKANISRQSELISLMAALRIGHQSNGVG